MSPTWLKKCKNLVPNWGGDDRVTITDEKYLSQCFQWEMINIWKEIQYEPCIALPSICKSKSMETTRYKETAMIKIQITKIFEIDDIAAYILLLKKWVKSDWMRSSTSQNSSSFSIYSRIPTNLLKINVANNGVLKNCIFQLSFIKGGARQYCVPKYSSFEISFLKINTIQNCIWEIYTYIQLKSPLANINPHMVDFKDWYVCFSILFNSGKGELFLKVSPLWRPS